MHHLGEVSVLLRVLEGHEVHAALPAEVPRVEPVPVLDLVPGFPPRQEVVVLAVLLVVLPVHAHLHLGIGVLHCTELPWALSPPTLGLLSSGLPSWPTLGLSWARATLAAATTVTSTSMVDM